MYLIVGKRIKVIYSCRIQRFIFTLFIIIIKFNFYNLLKYGTFPNNAQRSITNLSCHLQHHIRVQRIEFVCLRGHKTKGLFECQESHCSNLSKKLGRSHSNCSVVSASKVQLRLFIRFHKDKFERVLGRGTCTPTTDSKVKNLVLVISEKEDILYPRRG